MWGRSSKESMNKMEILIKRQKKKLNLKKKSKMKFWS